MSGPRSRLFAACLGVAAIGGFAVACATPEKEAMMSVEQTLEAHREALLAIRGVVGVGIGSDGGQKVIVVMRGGTASASEARIPSVIDGVRVIVQSTGPIRAY